MNIKTTVNLGKPYEEGYTKIDISLKHSDKFMKPKYTLSISALMDWEEEYQDFSGGGQCLDSVLDMYPENKLVKEIHTLWKKYHLNDMNAGTIEQSEYLDSLGEYKSYEWACEELKKVGLYKANYKGKKYTYGSAWLPREIPIEDVNRIKEIINNG